MKRRTFLARIRLPFALVQRIDVLGTQIRGLLHRRIPRARTVRALVLFAIDRATAPELVPIIAGDVVRQGREKARPA